MYLDDNDKKINWNTLSFLIFRKKEAPEKKMSKKKDTAQIFIQSKNPRVGSKCT